MNAISRITLDVGSYEQGANKIQRADDQMASSAKESFDKVGKAAEAGFAAVASNADRTARSYTDLAAAAQKAGQVLEASAKKMSAPWSNGPDESDRYRKWLQRADDTERGARARDAAAKVLSQSTAPGLIRVERPGERFQKHPLYTNAAPKKAGDSDEDGDDSPSNRQRNQELGHVLRSVVDSLAAGQSPLRVLGQEAPRVLQAFGSSVGTVLKSIGPLGYTAAGAAVAVGALAVAVEKAHSAAEARGQVLANAGLPESSIGGDTQANARKRIGELEAPIAKAQAEVDATVFGFSDFLVKARRAVAPANQGLGNLLSGIPGIGGGLRSMALSGNDEAGNTTQETLEQLQADQAARVRREVDVHGRDNKLSQKAASEGADAAASDRLEEEFKRRKDEIDRLVASNPKLGGTELLTPLRAEIDLRKQIADVQHVNINSNYTLAHQNAETAVGSSDVLVQDTSYHSKALDIARNNADAAQAELGRRANAGLNTREAQRQADSADVSLYQTINSTSSAGRVAESQTTQMGFQLQKLDAMANLEKIRSDYNEKILSSQQAGTTEITAALIARRDIATLEAQAAASDTPADRARGRNYRAALERSARAFNAHGGTRDADKEGGFARDATGPNSLIPDASAGLGAINSPFNAATPRNLAEYDAQQLPRVMQLVRADRTAEENRQKQPDKGGASDATLDPNVTALVTAIQGFAAKIGIA